MIRHVIVAIFQLGFLTYADDLFWPPGTKINYGTLPTHIKNQPSVHRIETANHFLKFDPSYKFASNDILIVVNNQNHVVGFGNKFLNDIAVITYAISSADYANPQTVYLNNASTNTWSQYEPSITYNGDGSTTASVGNPTILHLPICDDK